MKRFTYVLCVFLTTVVTGQSSKKEVRNIDVKNTKAIFLGSTGRVDRLMRLNITSTEKREQNKRVKKVHPNFFGRGLRKVTRPELEHLGPDPLRQITFPFQKSRVIIEPILNIDGLTNESDPQDPTGAIGSSHYLQAINGTEIGIYEKNGTAVDTLTGDDLWTPLGMSSRGDPIILFDQEEDRWLITEFANPANLLIAISETNDPLGSYFVYSFSTPEFPDYPKYGIWNNTYIVTTNEGGAGTLHQYFIDRAALIAGEEDVTIQRVEISGNESTEAGFYVTTPVDWNGATAPPDDQPMVIKMNDSSWGEVAEDVIEIYTFDIDFITPSNTTSSLTSIVTTPFDGFPCSSLVGGDFPCIPQKDGTGLDGIPEVIMNVPHYRNFGTHESIVLNFITDATDGENISGIRWMELRRAAGGDWTLYQEGTLAPDDGLHRFMGSIAMDGNGNIGLAYNVSGEDEFVGIRFTGRFANDPLGIMTVQETEVVAGQNVINTSSRFGDYAQMNVDPVDDMTFWYTSEYAGNGVDNDATTRIFSFQLERRTNDLAATAVVSPLTFATLSNSESIIVEVSNTGNSPVSGFDLQLFVDDNLIVTDNVSSTLDPQDVLEHIFSQTVDLSVIGEHAIRYNIVFGDDEANQNDTLEEIVNSIYPLNVSVEAEIDENQLCTESLSSEITITNRGGNTVTSVDIEITLNEELQEIISWTGSLETNESEVVEFELSNFSEGQNSIHISVSNPNGSNDQNLADNEVVTNLEFLGTFDQFIFNLNTDDFPGETTWTVTDAQGELIANGGPYTISSTNVKEFLCLENDQCYTFTIFDSALDGICCEFGNGSFSFIGPDGEAIFESNGEFGASEENEICNGIVCNLSAEISTVDATLNVGGSISIEAAGGLGYQYSIDGGKTFLNSPIFNSLESGIYNVVVTSNDGVCQFTETVEVSLALSLGQVNKGFNVWPNPSSEGMFRFSFTNETIEGFLSIELLSADGKILQSRKFSRYDKSFEGTISLYAYPEGMYFFRLKDFESRLIKIIKK